MHKITHHLILSLVDLVLVVALSAALASCIIYSITR